MSTILVKYHQLLYLVTLHYIWLSLNIFFVSSYMHLHDLHACSSQYMVIYVSTLCKFFTGPEKVLQQCVIYLGFSLWEYY